MAWSLIPYSRRHMPSLPFEHNNTVAPLDYKFSRTKENIKKKN